MRKKRKKKSSAQIKNSISIQIREKRCKLSIYGAVQFAKLHAYFVCMAIKVRGIRKSNFARCSASGVYVHTPPRMAVVRAEMNSFARLPWSARQEQSRATRSDASAKFSR